MDFDFSVPCTHVWKTLNWKAAFRMQIVVIIPLSATVGRLGVIRVRVRVRRPFKYFLYLRVRDFGGIELYSWGVSWNYNPNRIASVNLSKSITWMITQPFSSMGVESTNMSSGLKKKYIRSGLLSFPKYRTFCIFLLVFKHLEGGGWWNSPPKGSCAQLFCLHISCLQHAALYTFYAIYTLDVT